MWPFNRNKNSPDSLSDKVSPTAVKEYYQAAGNRQPWLVWLLSIATFLVTLIVVLLLFWGGRWVWHKVSDSSDNKATPATQEQSGAASEQEADKQGTNNNGDAAPAPSPAPTPTPTPQTAPTTTPSTGPTTSENLPNTGPDLDL